MTRALKILFFVLLFFALSLLEFSPFVFLLITIFLATKPGSKKLIMLAIAFLLLRSYQEEAGQLLYVSLVFLLCQKSN